MRFLLDENIPRDCAATLREIGHDVLWVPESQLRTRPDNELIAVCNSEDRYMITRDVGMSFAARQLQTGFVLIRAPDTAVAREVNALLISAQTELSEDKLRGNVLVITERKFRIRTLAAAAEAEVESD